MNSLPEPTSRDSKLSTSYPPSSSSSVPSRSPFFIIKHMLTCSCTTFLLAAEVYPISVRATAHGLSAAAGKLGALIPAILYNYIDAQTRFWVVCWFGFAGWIVTELFIPDTTGLDLREQDRYWAFVREGRAGEYHGIAVHPRHLSWWERVVLKRGQAYDPELDRKQRVKELRVVYEARMQEKELNKGEQMEDDDEGSEITKGLHTYFTSTSISMSGR
jgi:hypothetical protein